MFYEVYIPKQVQLELEANAFRTLCEHLRERSDVVANMDLMSLSGFCRNCLAKWLVVEARLLSQTLAASGPNDSCSNAESNAKLISSLNAFGYDEAAEYVYGVTYPEWKKRYQKKATEDQLAKYEASKSLHAIHDKSLLEKRGDIQQLKKEDEDEHLDQCVSHRFFETYVTPEARIILEAGAYRRLCQHLRERSHEVQNMALMTLSGFCRNCLAKWLVLEARRLASSLDTRLPGVQREYKDQLKLVLDAFGYEDAAEFVYGTTVGEWKKRYQTKATDEQMKAYNDSVPIQAKHDKELLEVRVDKESLSEPLKDDGKFMQILGNASVSDTVAAPRPLLSNVCCQDVDALCPPSSQKDLNGSIPSSDSDPLLVVLPPPGVSVELRLGILTVSDRASANQYATGDLSGPAVEQAVKRVIHKTLQMFPSSPGIDFRIVRRGIVPDEIDIIASTLKEWCATSPTEAASDECNLIFTTGGTGFAPRDVTPEATLKVLTRESRGLMAWASIECSKVQPMAANSRGVAGLVYKADGPSNGKDACMIINLPGSPRGAEQVTTVLLPLLFHAIADIKRQIN